MTAGGDEAPSAPDRRRGAAAWARFLGVGLLVAALDLATKAWAFTRLPPRPARFGADGWLIPPHDPVILIPGLLGLKLTANTGAVFGIGEGGRLFFVAVSVAAIGLIGHVFRGTDSSQRATQIALGLLLAGAAGNLYDRVRFGAVRDLIWLFPGSGLWPWLFNVADAALVTGVALMLVLSFLPTRRERA